MDRPEPGLIKWSPNAKFDSFLHINLQHRVVQVYEPEGHAKNGSFQYKKLSQHDDFPPLTTYDWSPSMPGLLAVGTQAGIVNLLRIDDNSNAYLELNLKMARTCQAVAFSTQGMLAVGLDRVRSDQCLYVWDVNRLSEMNSDSASKGFPSGIDPFIEPAVRREPSLSVSSVKFFEDNPNTLVVGIKTSGLRIHDIRAGHNPVSRYETKCNNNLAIDYSDQNYFASSALDQPGIMIWDRRATDLFQVSPSYLNAHQDGLPFGGALWLENALELESSQSMSDSKNSFIRSLRYCRDHRGLLAVLSRTGQLKVLTTTAEPTEEVVEESPELLLVRRSHEMGNYYSDPAKKNDRIVSFDWVTMGNPVQRPRLLVLRANGAFEILEVPSFARTYPYKLSPWKAPHRGLESGGNHHDIIGFEPHQATQILAPAISEDELADIPIFGGKKPDVLGIVQGSLQTRIPSTDLLQDLAAKDSPQLPESFKNAVSVAEKMRILRQYAKEHLRDAPQTASSRTDSATQAMSSLAVSQGRLITNRERHEELLSLAMGTMGFPKEAQIFLNHVPLLRAKEMYLFDYEKNRSIVADDPWLRDVWIWILGAEEAVADGGMISHPLDLSYMGVATVWLNNLGKTPSTRLADGSTVTPDTSAWERSINAMCRKRGISRFEGVETKWPHHRELCLDICGWGRAAPMDLLEFEQTPSLEKTSTWHTMSTAHALFSGDTKRAVEILRKASSEHPELLFVSLALQLIGRGDATLAKEQLDFDEKVASRTDPYLRAISSLIATGDWTTITNQRSLPLRERAFVAVRHLTDDQLTEWLRKEVAIAIEHGDIEGIVLTGITDNMVDILAKYVERFHDLQAATLIMSICAPRYIDDFRCAAWRKSYRAYLQRHRAFLQRTKFEVESTKKSKRDGLPTIKPPFRQIALRCIYCDAETSLSRGPSAGGMLHGPSALSASTTVGGGGIIMGPAPPPPPPPPPSSSGAGESNPLMAKLADAGISCPTCKRHLPRCVVCLEVVGMPRSDRPELAADPQVQLAARFPTFCLKCEHVLHLDHARQWFARHAECPVPECRCRCNFRANPELNYK
ncbi:hypothetical protein GGTG_01880 [Gaeumannomyces tritici R3-111a-1]|uniref:Uncharacterized protein n=1 Tax=Gaeumannomyces tritici (strain R3-111a-1) TaxID=644352 RepID=J3NKT9_GAET3|nr:hypothetical protein GGTG_01880 [Gaeumannomyces tritici R3-111a-1]EJT81906.1 hypothetical protein GGTG_01880 [Gaeumannomyces tritici R3-111a-1]